MQRRSQWQCQEHHHGARRSAATWPLRGGNPANDARSTRLPNGTGGGVVRGMAGRGWDQPSPWKPSIGARAKKMETLQMNVRLRTPSKVNYYHPSRLLLACVLRLFRPAKRTDHERLAQKCPTASPMHAGFMSPSVTLKLGSVLRRPEFEFSDLEFCGEKISMRQDDAEDEAANCRVSRSAISPSQASTKQAFLSCLHLQGSFGENPSVRSS